MALLRLLVPFEWVLCDCMVGRSLGVASVAAKNQTVFEVKKNGT